MECLKNPFKRKSNRVVISMPEYFTKNGRHRNIHNVLFIAIKTGSQGAGAEKDKLMNVCEWKKQPKEL